MEAAEVRDLAAWWASTAQKHRNRSENATSERGAEAARADFERALEIAHKWAVIAQALYVVPVGG